VKRGKLQEGLNKQQLKHSSSTYLSLPGISFSKGGKKGTTKGRGKEKKGPPLVFL